MPKTTFWRFWKHVLQVDVPILISFLALLVSAWTLHEGLKQAEMAQTPFTRFWLRGSIAEPYVGIFLENHGLGAAKVDLAIFYNGTRVNDWIAVTDGFFNDKLVRTHDDSPSSPSWTTFQAQMLLKSADSIPLFYIDPKYLDNIGQFVKHLGDDLIIVAHSCSLYEECSYLCFGNKVGNCDDFVKRQKL